MSYEKALTSYTKRGSGAGRKKKRKENRKINCLIRASGRKSVTPMHTPGFCLADRHDDNFILSSLSISEPLFKMKVLQDCLCGRGGLHGLM